ncbi:DUF4276 family protein [Pantoea ananatis]|uniref:DUF4276 family protein n=1 Tax=Pantoea ananas TaxID=553 RepID=UPI00221F3E1E|nr:DUF4276 family protein [Pantoea ananatis]
MLEIRCGKRDPCNGSLGEKGKGPFFHIEKGVLKSSSEATFPAVVSDRLAMVAASGLPAFRPIFDALTAMGFYNLNPKLMRELQKPQDGKLLKPVGENIASVIGHLEKVSPDQVKLIQEYLQKVAPMVHGMERKAVGPMETLEFRQDVAGAKYPWRFFAQNMSDGTLRALGVLTALLQNNVDYSPSMIGIEEPETALDLFQVAPFSLRARQISIVEGDGEVSALPVLLRRLAEWMPALSFPNVLRPIRVKRDRFLRKEDEFRKQLLLAAAKCGDDGWIVILLDADDECPAEVGRTTLERALRIVQHRKVSVILANREFEAWFLASAESIHGYRGFSVEKNEQVDAEAPRDAKGWMSRHMNDGTYREILDQPAFAAIFSLQLAYDNSRSFRKLCKEWKVNIQQEIDA